MRRLLPLVFLFAFFALLLPRMMESMARGDVYPDYSTLRSDPYGAKVLFESLRRTTGNVARNYEAWTTLDGVNAHYVLLGASPLVLKEEKDFGPILSGGGVLLIALAPASSKSNIRTEKMGFIHNVGGLELRGELWKCVIGDPAKCSLAERRAGKGTIRLLWSVRPLSNANLFENRDAELVAKLFPKDRAIVFDESHLGVEESGGVGVLLRRYRLMPAVALLLGVALLFVWRNSTPLTPEKEPVTAAMTPQPAASLRTLLEQNVPASKLLETLVEEWKRARHLLPVWHAGRADEIEQTLAAAKTRKDNRQGYAELRAALRPRKGNMA
jgi:hypothetical protein